MRTGFPKVGRFLLILSGVVVALSCLSPLARGQAKRILAPELEGGVGWIGIDKPLQLKDLRGKFVVFDFWTLC